MVGWLKPILVALVVMVALWALLVALAARLPAGLLKDLAGFLPACVTLARRLRADPRVPFKAKAAVVLAGLWVLSPIDLLPEFLPVIGPLDDVVVVALALRYAARRVPPDVLLEAWPGEPRLLKRLLGTSAPAKQCWRSGKSPLSSGCCSRLPPAGRCGDSVQPRRYDRPQDADRSSP